MQIIDIKDIPKVDFPKWDHRLTNHQSLMIGDFVLNGLSPKTHIEREQKAEAREKFYVRISYNSSVKTNYCIIEDVWN